MDGHSINIFTQLEKNNIENVTHSCCTLLPTLPAPQSKWVTMVKILRWSPDLWIPITK